MNLDLLRRAFADQQVVLPLHVLHHGVVHLIARNAHRPRVHDAGERNHRDIRGAAADIDHHVAARFGDRQARADRRHHGLFHQMHFARLRAIRRIHNRALFHLRDLAGDADDDAGMHQHLPVVRLVDEVIQHLLGDFEVSDDAVFHRLDGDDIARRAAQHFLGFLTDGLDFAGCFVQRDDRRLVDNNAFSLRENQRVGGAKVDGKIRRK